MPLYDFECTAGHRFEKNVPSAEFNTPVPCEAVSFQTDLHPPVPTYCDRQATGIITHSNPRGLLDHGLGANRDAALAGNWDPNRPITRGVRR